MDGGGSVGEDGALLLALPCHRGACAGGFRGAPLDLQAWEGKACGWVSGLSRPRGFAEVIFNLFCATACWEMLLSESS